MDISVSEKIIEDILTVDKFMIFLDIRVLDAERLGFLAQQCCKYKI